MNRPDIIPGFEGMEKKLEIDFTGIPQTSPGLLAIPDEDWSAVILEARAVILSVKRNPIFTAYLLSESSLFVYQRKVLIKTCGTTTLLRCIPTLKQVVKNRLGPSVTVEFVQFSRSNYLYESEQEFPHGSFQSEASYLDSHFQGGTPYTLGPISGPTWHIWIADYTEPNISAYNFTDQTIEIIMYGLDDRVMQHFYQAEGYTPDEATTKSGISTLYSSETLVDAHLFTPCGYSMNGLDGDTYYTIHITPESHCSYVSFETNKSCRNVMGLIKSVASVFNPSKLAVTVFADSASTCMGFDLFKGESHVPEFKMRSLTSQNFGGIYHAVTACWTKLENSDFVPAILSGNSPLAMTGSSTSSLPLGKSNIKVLPEGDRIMSIKVAEQFMVERYNPEKFSLKRYIQDKIKKNMLEEDFFIADMSNVLARASAFAKNFPKISALYNVKCNAMPLLLTTLRDLGFHFACYTSLEIEHVLAVGVSPSRILFSNRSKHPSQLRYAATKEVHFTSFSNKSEIDKFAAVDGNFNLLLHFDYVENEMYEECSVVNECRSLLDYAHSHGVKVVGVKFHTRHTDNNDISIKVSMVTSAIKKSRVIFDYGKQLGFDMSIVNIGGDIPDAVADLPAFAKAVNAALAQFYPEQHINVMAEPGRFLTCDFVTMVANVLTSNEVKPAKNLASKASSLKPSFHYYVADDRFGHLDSSHLDNVSVHHLRDEANGGKESLFSSSVYVSTYDGREMRINKEEHMLPKLTSADWLYFTNLSVHMNDNNFYRSGINTTQVFPVVACDQVEGRMEWML